MWRTRSLTTAARMWYGGVHNPAAYPSRPAAVNVCEPRVRLAESCRLSLAGRTDVADVVRALSGLVLISQGLHNLTGVLKLSQVILEHSVLLIVVQESLATHELVVLRETAREQVPNAARERACQQSCRRKCS